MFIKLNENIFVTKNFEGRFYDFGGVRLGGGVVHLSKQKIVALRRNQDCFLRFWCFTGGWCGGPSKQTKNRFVTKMYHDRFLRFRWCTVE